MPETWIIRDIGKRCHDGTPNPDGYAWAFASARAKAMGVSMKGLILNLLMAWSNGDVPMETCLVARAKFIKALEREHDDFSTRGRSKRAGVAREARRRAAASGGAVRHADHTGALVLNDSRQADDHAGDGRADSRDLRPTTERA